jgi:hypothetical protein
VGSNGQVITAVRSQATGLKWAAPAAGTVTSVALTTPGLLFDVSGSPVTASGTLAVSLKTQNANKVLAGPASGADAAPTMRAIVPADLPVMVASGASHAAGIVPDPGSTAGTTRFLREDGTWVAPSGGGGGSGASVGVADTVPSLSGFSWLNQGTATATQETYGITLFTPAAVAADVNRGLMIAVPAAPYVITARMRYTLPANTNKYSNTGFAWYDSVSGKLHTVGPSYNYNTNPYSLHRFIQWNSVTSFNADSAAGSNAGILGTFEWFRVGDNGTNRYYQVSPDGKTWTTVFTLSRSNWITPTHVGIFADPYNNNLAPYIDGIVTLFSWKVE